MPEYLAPGVYLEEVSFRSNTIEGVGTTTTGFIGPASFGPVTQPTDVLTSLADYERIYGGGDVLEFIPDPQNPGDTFEMPNFLWQGVRAFFTEGGTMLYVTRAFRPIDNSVYPPDWSNPQSTVAQGTTLWNDGHGRLQFGDFEIRARFPGALGNFKLNVTITAGQNVLGALKNSDGTYSPTYGALHDRDVVVVIRGSSASPTEEPTQGDLCLAQANPQTTGPTQNWKFLSLNSSPVSGGSDGDFLTFNVDPAPGVGDSIRVLTVTINVKSLDGTEDYGTWSDLPLDPDHEKGGEADSVFALFPLEPPTLALARSLPIVLAASQQTTGLELVQYLVPNILSYLSGETIPGNVTLDKQLTQGVTRPIYLTGGNDGQRPQAADYEGMADDDKTFKTGLYQFEDVDEISIVAAPGSTFDYSNYRDEANTIMSSLITHAEKMRYRIAVLDSPPGLSLADVRAVRAKIDSSWAAFYYPWVTILDPISNKELQLPPSGFVTGIYARNDINRAVYKAPANEVVNLAINFEQLINKAQQEVLNPEGINCFRYFPDRGFRLWGARTCSSDPEWKYVNVRRYFIYLEHSVDKGTQWVVFEPNSERLWANVRRTIQDFLLNEWQQGALMGDKPEQAYFVRCDRSTMTQNDLDNGRLVCLIGVAPVYPAEFVIFRIGQWTAGSSQS